MALKIKVSEVNKEIILAMGGKPITEDIYVRPTFQPVWKGYDIDIWFRYFFDTQKEDAFASLQLFVVTETQIPILDANDEPTGETTTTTTKLVLSEDRRYKWVTLQPLTGQVYQQAQGIYNQIKDIPQVAQMVALIGNTALLTNIGIHLMSKSILEDIFGEGTVEIDLFLQ
jgi:hypothetical protein